ncbi:hypothetical protein OFN50_36685, partial [Escherichia coli]|nr:hypothetical protein [Escherichia coli]
HLATACVSSVHVCPAGVRAYMPARGLSGSAARALDVSPLFAGRMSAGAACAAAADAGGGKAFTYDDAQLLSPHGASLAAVAIVR